MRGRSREESVCVWGKGKLRWPVTKHSETALFRWEIMMDDGDLGMWRSDAIKRTMTLIVIHISN